MGHHTGENSDKYVIIDRFRSDLLEAVVWGYLLEFFELEIIFHDALTIKTLS